MTQERIHWVGTTGFDYKQRRNFVGLPLRRYRYRKIYNYLSPLMMLTYGLRRRTNPFAGNLHGDLGLTRCDLYHFFFTISAGPKPWVVTFSDVVPRWVIKTEAKLDFGMRLLAGAHCKQLIALSENCYLNQLRFLDRFPQWRASIAAKLRVLHPAQPPLIRDYGDKRLDDDAIVLTFVGDDFFRKGGREVLRVVGELLRQGCPLKLNIVSALRYGDYASQAQREDLRAAYATIAAFPRQITHYETLPNDRVLALFERSHVGLLPTYDDTYGYAVLEAQASGCPVITTDIRVMPEINNEEIGWLIELPKDEWGQAVLTSEDERRRCAALITDQLYAIIKALCAAPEEIRCKGRRALARIRREHDPYANAAVLEDLYDAILARAI